MRSTPLKRFYCNDLQLKESFYNNLIEAAKKIGVEDAVLPRQQRRPNNMVEFLEPFPEQAMVGGVSILNSVVYNVDVDVDYDADAVVDVDVDISGVRTPQIKIIFEICKIF